MDLKLQKALFLKHIAQTSKKPFFLDFVKAHGIYLYNNEGDKFIDLIGGVSVSTIGHGHRDVIRALRQQSRNYMHLMVYGEYIQAPQVILSKTLIDTLPSSLDNVYFVNSGSEGIEGAMKLAKRYTRRTQLISCYDAYHGSTHGALSACGVETLKSAFRPLVTGMSFINYNRAHDLDMITERTAGVIVESIQAEAGVIIPDISYMQLLQKRCQEVGALLIVDEVQTCMGRTGKFWGFEHYNIIPDIIVCAKAIGGGMPLGAFIASKQIMNCLQEDPSLGHITTFGGHPVSTATSLATIKVLQKESIISKVHHKGSTFAELLNHEKIKEVRFKGLLIAVEFDTQAFAAKVIEKCIENGLLIDLYLFQPNCIRISPPLNIKKKYILRSCDIILNAINEVSLE